MGERKVLNKYFPPDFDPALIPKVKMAKDHQMKIRMMLPMSVRCKTCGNFMYKGTKFNSRKEDVHGKNYLGIQIYRFYFRCSNCSAEYTILTDPKNSDYTVESGASRNYEPWREEEESKKLSLKEREEEERGNAIKALENRQLDSKREMDVLSALDELRSLNARKQKLSFDQVLSALKKSEQEETEQHERERKKRSMHQPQVDDDLDPEDEEAIRALFYQQRAKLQKTMKDDSSEGEGSGGSQEEKDSPRLESSPLEKRPSVADDRRRQKSSRVDSEEVQVAAKGEASHPMPELKATEALLPGKGPRSLLKPKGKSPSGLFGTKLKVKVKKKKKKADEAP